MQFFYIIICNFCIKHRQVNCFWNLLLCSYGRPVIVRCMGFSLVWGCLRYWVQKFTWQSQVSYLVGWVALGWAGLMNNSLASTGLLVWQCCHYTYLECSQAKFLLSQLVPHHLNTILSVLSWISYVLQVAKCSAGARRTSTETRRRFGSSRI